MMNPETLQLPGNNGLYEEYYYSCQHNELLTKTDGGIFLLSISGSIIDSIPFPMHEDGTYQESELVASSRNDSGWQILLREDNKLFITQIPRTSNNRVHLEGEEPDAKTTAWSACGRFIAVGNQQDYRLTVWDVETGKRFWKNTAVFEAEGQLINPPSLSVTGWSSDGKGIVTTAEYLAFCTIIIWKSDTGDIQTAIN